MMKAHKYWGIGAFACMLITMITGHDMKSKNAHKYWALGSCGCMVMALYTGYRMMHKKPKKKVTEKVEEAVLSETEEQ